MDQYIGRLLDNRYEILEEIGSGGMAVVYKARCHRLNRLVAIKILKDEFSGDEEFRRRFRAEGEAVAMLSHPNIVQVYDVSSSDRANFIVMELIDGVSLKQYMEAKGVLNWKETLHFAMQIAQGLGHAHSRGIIHRDIKPHNVMALKNGSVKVMDFGIARVMSKSNTLTKEALGSVHYISPEQARGSYTDNRSDLYSLGVVMYEMMTGRPPYDGESPVAVAIQHINGGAVRPSVLNPNIPRGMEQIIMKAMALDISGRYVSAAEMLRDMEEFRKNPEIVFNYHTLTDDATQPIPIAPNGRIMTEAGIAKRRNVNMPRPAEGGETPRPRKKGDGQSSRSALRKKQEEERRARERSRIATVAIVVCSTVAVVSIAIFLIALFNGALLNQEKELVEVPFLLDEVYDEGYTVKYQDFTIRLQPQQYSDTYEKGRIMYQEPMGGSKVVKGTELWLTVSMGAEPKEGKMLDYYKADFEETKKTLEDDGYTVVVYYEDNPLTKGKIFRTEPAMNQTLIPGQEIKLYVSNGFPVVMPNLEGETQEDALKSLSDLGFDSADIIIKKVDSDEPEGTVVLQTPKEYEQVDLSTDTKIFLEISRGPKETEPTEESTEPPVLKYTMVNVVNLGLDIARQNLNTAGFNNITVVYEPSDSIEADRVITQQPVENELHPLGEEVILHVSSGPAVAKGMMRNTVFLSVDTAETELKSAGFQNITFLYVRDDAKAGQVISQNFKKGTEIPLDSQIVLEVSGKEVQVSLTLPEKTEAFLLSLVMDGREVMEPVELSGGTTEYTAVLYGLGNLPVDICVDGQLYKTIEVEFGK